MCYCYCHCAVIDPVVHQVINVGLKRSAEYALAGLEPIAEVLDTVHTSKRTLKHS